MFVIPIFLSIGWFILCILLHKYLKDQQIESRVLHGLFYGFRLFFAISLLYNASLIPFWALVVAFA